MSRAEQVSRKYIEYERIRGLEEARKVVNWKGVQYYPVEGVSDETAESLYGVGQNKTGDKNGMWTKSPEIWQQVAISRNVALNCHTDDDFFLSCLTVAVDDKPYLRKCEPVQYFAFPEDGVAVALHPGDILIFNHAYHIALRRELIWMVMMSWFVRCI
jgi:hypothetical protein